jgi:hypothetical protein
LPERFFVNGKPNDIAAFRTNLGTSLWSKCLKNNIKLINKHFNKKEVFSRDKEKWLNPIYGKKSRLTYFTLPYAKFLTLRTPHNAQPYTKTLFGEVWKFAEEELTVMSSNRFRSESDYTQELFRTWQICTGNFNPYNTYSDTKMFPLLIRKKQAVIAIRQQSYKLICINDNEHIRNFEKTASELRDAFESILPEKSSFEL